MHFLHDAFDFAAAGGRHDLVKAIMAEPDFDAHATLLFAAKNGRTSSVKVLLDQPDVDINTVDADGITPLMWAMTEFRRESLIEAILASKPALDIAAKNGDTALLLGATNYPDLVAKVVREEEVSVDHQNAEGSSLLHLAARYQLFPLLLALHDKGAHLDIQTVTGETPLYRAAEWGSSAAVKLLVDAGADVNRKRHDGKTPLSIACNRVHVEVVRLLLAAGADINTQDTDGVTPLREALRRAEMKLTGEHQAKEIVELLREQLKAAA